MCPQGQTRLSLNAALAAVLAAAVLAVPTLARAGDDDVPIDTKIMRSIMDGLGFKRADQAEINYQERAPLVIPPNSDLPPPQKAGAVIANNPAWPKDPDIARAKVYRAQETNRDTTAEFEREQNPLPPDQIAPGPKGPRTASRQTKQPDDPSGNVNDENFHLTPAQLGYHGGLFTWNGLFGGKDEEASAKFTGEPKRTSLTDPPAGYQTPSPDQPFGLGKAATAPKPTDYYTTHGEVSSDR
jgi:hypothetical protein